jgi:hypothetical protein
MSINRVASHRPVATPHHKPAAAPAWLKSFEHLTRTQLSRLPAPAASTLPKSVATFWKQQQDALADNDGSAAIMKIGSKGYAIRWTSEDSSLDRLFVYDHAGKPVAKGWTDTGGAFKWSPAKSAFHVDDTPHS